MIYRMKQTGFSLIEVMIAIAIVGILATVAVPQYSLYVKRAKFAELKLAAFPVKIALMECYDAHRSNTEICNASTTVERNNGPVSDSMLTESAVSNNIDKISISANGDNPVITVFPTSAKHLSATDTYELIGEVNTGANGEKIITGWTEGGGGCDAGYC